MNVKLNQFFLRLLSSVIDMMIILLPVMMIGLYVFQFSFKISELYSQGVFMLYNILLVDWYKGQTLGKKVARIHVVFDEGDEEPLIKKSMREVCKLLYFLPVVGFVFCLLSLVIYLIKGKFLHDIAGNSQVVLEKIYIKEYTTHD